MEEKRARERLRRKEEAARLKEEQEEKALDAKHGFRIWVERKEQEKQKRQDMQR